MSDCYIVYYNYDELRPEVVKCEFETSICIFEVLNEISKKEVTATLVLSKNPLLIIKLIRKLESQEGYISIEELDEISNEAIIFILIPVDYHDSEINVFEFLGKKTKTSYIVFKYGNKWFLSNNWRITVPNFILQGSFKEIPKEKLRLSIFEFINNL